MRSYLPHVLFLLCACTASAPSSDPSWQALIEDRPGGLLRAWGLRADDVYVVGANGDGGTTDVLHFDGRSWDALESPATEALWWVSAVNADDVRMVGDDGVVLKYTPSTGEFETREVPTTLRLFGAWGSSSSDVWYVGGDSAQGQGVILHDDGDEVVVVEHPSTEDAAFFKVQGFAADAVWFVGQLGTTLFWDGTDFETRETGTALPLMTIHGTDADHVFAAGGVVNGVLLAWDGTEWQDETPSGTPQMIGVWSASDTLTYAAGFNGRVYRRENDAWSEWVDAAPTFQDIHSVWVDDEEGLWLAGGRLAEDPPSGGVLVHYGLPVSTRGLH